jgi:four helix bundle protein
MIEKFDRRGHRDLQAWQLGMKFARAVYMATRSFPDEEMYGLTSQLRRASVSVPSNIAEGYGRKSYKELHRFIGNSIGSVLEAETQIELAGDFGFVQEHVVKNLLQQTQGLVKVLNGLRSWTAKQINEGSTPGL